jgi:hypothetical protein
MDSQIELQKPILDGGIRSVNFFNGRLLTGRDLSREQVANHEADRRLGQAAGEGVAFGLEVSRSAAATAQAPVVTVQPGLAINRRGQTLALGSAVDITLVRQASAGTVLTQTFGACLPPQFGTYVAGPGVYLLTLAPAAGTEGRALTSGLDNALAQCNTDTIVEAVQLRLLQLDPPLTPGDLQDQKHLRNLVAYKCFGVTEAVEFIGGAFNPSARKHRLLDELRDNPLTECDVPLAVLYWTLSDGLKFIDLWAVRRRLTRQAVAGRWSPLADERRASEGEAMFLQFAAQALDMLLGEAPDAGTVVATEHFEYLPPAGILPLKGSGGLKGFDDFKFFQGLTTRKVIFIEGSRVEHLIRDSFAYPPIKLSSQEVIWRYFVRENMQASGKNSINPVQPYMVFTSGHMPFQGDARFDRSYWDFGNYSPVFA